MAPPRKYKNEREAKEARRKQINARNRRYAPSSLIWRVIHNNEIVALFKYERDARGFAKARYKNDYEVGKRQTRN
jgi:hypothetical protein